MLFGGRCSDLLSAGVSLVYVNVHINSCGAEVVCVVQVLVSRLLCSLFITYSEKRLKYPVMLWICLLCCSVCFHRAEITYGPSVGT